MKSVLEEINPVKKKITIEIEPESVAKEMDKAIKDVAKKTGDLGLFGNVLDGLVQIATIAPRAVSVLLARLAVDALVPRQTFAVTLHCSTRGGNGRGHRGRQ